MKWICVAFGALLFAVLCSCNCASKHPEPAELTATTHAHLTGIGDCNNLADIGVWENATPDDVWTQLPNGGCGYGTRSFAIDPNDASSIYLGTCAMGIWATHDCGSTWTHIDTGTSGPNILDHARQWFYAIDPTNSLVQYTSSGYGPGVHAGNGTYKTVDGGVNWAAIWPPANGTFYNVVTSNFGGSLLIDPANTQHLLLTFHAKCNLPYTPVCFGETMDGGTTWTLISGNPAWVGSVGGQYLWMLPGQPASFLLYANAVYGYFYSLTGLAGPWLPSVGLTNQESHEGGDLTQVGGVYYMAVAEGVATSTDGITWTVTRMTANPGSGITTDGTSIFYTKGFSGPPYPPGYFMASTPDGVSWSVDTSLQTVNGGWLAYDAVHAEEWASMRQAGVWRRRLH